MEGLLEPPAEEIRFQDRSEEIEVYMASYQDMGRNDSRSHCACLCNRVCVPKIASVCACDLLHASIHLMPTPERGSLFCRCRCIEGIEFISVSSVCQ